MALAVIVVLLMLVIGEYIYYHGIFALGPYASARGPTRTASKRKRKASSSASALDAASEADPETERLIESINQQ